MLKLKDFFYLQRNDRQALLVLLGIIIVCTTLVIIVGRTSPSPNDYHSSSRYGNQENRPTRISGKTTKQAESEQHPLYYKVDGIPHELFHFDPNTADSTQLLKLGLQAWQVRSIYRYRAKGGIFRDPSDFARLYGLTKKQYEVLEPYIEIGEDYRPASDYYGKTSYHSYPRNNHNHSQDIPNGDKRKTEKLPPEEKVYSYPHKLIPGQQISINSADTTELMKIPGIGSYYAKSIVRYREQLGGFVSLSQIKEIEGIPDSAIPFIHIDSHGVKKLNINQLTLNQLRRHPYINFYQAKEICDYRRLHGPIKNLQELKLLKDFPPAEIARLEPYIDF